MPLRVYTDFKQIKVLLSASAVHIFSLVLGMEVVKIGGPVYRIGVGGGAASSVQVDADVHLLGVYVELFDCCIWMLLTALFLCVCVCVLGTR